MPVVPTATGTASVTGTTRSLPPTDSKTKWVESSVPGGAIRKASRPSRLPAPSEN